MAESYVQVPADDAGKKLRTIEGAIGLNTVHDEVVELAKADRTIINPATEDGNLATLAAVDFSTETTLALAETHLGTIETKATDIETNTDPSTSPTPYNVTMVNANTEYSQALPAGTKQFQIATRDRYVFRIAFTNGKVAAPVEPYMTIATNEVWWFDNVKLAATTVYFACSRANKVVELLAWT